MVLQHSCALTPQSLQLLAHARLEFMSKKINMESTPMHHQLCNAAVHGA
jgi:hypothetical protein